MPYKAPILKQTVISTRTKKRVAESFDRRRGSSYERGYDAAWQKVRLQHLKAEPLCRHCLERGLIVAAEEVDHIKPIRIAPDLRLDDTNLQSLCKSCHSKKTYQETIVACKL